MKKAKINLSIIKFGMVLMGIAVAVVALCEGMVLYGNTIIENQTQRYLMELSRQSSYKVNHRVKFNMSFLSHISANLSMLRDDPELCLKYSEEVMSCSPFTWIGITDNTGVLITENPGNINFSQEKIVGEALRGKSGVAEEIIALYGDEKGPLYATPYRQDGEVSGAVLGWVSPAVMAMMEDTDTFDGSGFCHVISPSGNFISYSDNPNAIMEFDNVYQGFEDGTVVETDSLEEMKQDIAQRRSGSLRYALPTGEERCIYYTPLQFGNWYLLSIVCPELYSEQFGGYTQVGVYINLLIAALFSIFIVVILWTTRRKNKQIEQIAYIDPVTGGFTAARFEIEAAEILKARNPFAFVTMDIRKFKLINDSFGSEQGNRVLRYIYEMVCAQLETGEYVARISSDTFNIVLRETNQEEIAKRLERITNTINSFNDNSMTLYYLPLDFGVYIANTVETDIIAIRDRANTARKNNKNAGERYLCSCVFYNDIERLNMLREKEMENSMERALHKKEFVIYLQPKVDIISGQVVGAEALVRWNSPEKGLIPPNDFIPFFERIGFILKLDLYVFQEVCRLLRRWLDAGWTPLPISVNLSRNHLRVPNFLDRFKEIQQTYQVPPELLEIELTETVVFENVEFLKQIIDEIHAWGFQCSMDDFGSGYSSLNVLKEIPVDILKLDKAFFNKGNDQRGNDVVESVVNLAKKLGMLTVAEGVETTTQVDFLRQAGCDIVQGFVFAKPMPIEDFEKSIYTV